MKNNDLSFAVLSLIVLAGLVAACLPASDSAKADSGAVARSESAPARHGSATGGAAVRF
jgi:hypothetical protein